MPFRHRDCLPRVLRLQRSLTLALPLRTLRQSQQPDLGSNRGQNSLFIAFRAERSDQRERSRSAKRNQKRLSKIQKRRAERQRSPKSKERRNQTGRRLAPTKQHLRLSALICEICIRCSAPLPKGEGTGVRAKSQTHCSRPHLPQPLLSQRARRGAPENHKISRSLRYPHLKNLSPPPGCSLQNADRSLPFP